MTLGTARPTSTLHRVVIPAPKPSLTLAVAREFGLAKPGQAAELKAWKRHNEAHLERGLRDLEARERGRGPAFLGALWAVLNRADGSRLDLGLISARVVTTAGVNYLVRTFQNLDEPELLRFHGMGTGTTAEATSDTALAAELTTQYTTTSTRPQGTLAQGGTANVFQTVATVSVKAAAAITEHGIFTQAAAPGGTLLDRSVFAVVNLAANESIQFTYELTLPAGG